jgi:peroxiredoxin family protein
MAEQKKLSIIAFSGDFDKLTAVFTLGTGAAAVGYEVNIFFTSGALTPSSRSRAARLLAAIGSPNSSAL